MIYLETIYLEKIEIFLLLGLGICFIIQMLYYSIFFTKILRYKAQISRGKHVFSSNSQAVSVIICAQNESQNLSKYLPSILSQDYPVFEVIVVNDGSTDESEEILGQLENTYKNLYRTYVPSEVKSLSRKKLAVTIGAKAAKYDLLLFAEASSEPVSKDWIRLMARHFDSEKSVVLGFSAFSKSQGFFNKFAVYDNLFTGMQYLSLALLGRPYMGVKGNMAYKKELFFSHKGFYKHLNLQAGEDDLFINEVATRSNTAVEISQESITVNHLNDLSIWREMKISRATTQRYYKRDSVFFLRVESFSSSCFFLFSFALLFIGFSSYPIIITVGLLFFLRLLVQVIVINKNAISLGVERFYFTLPIFDFILLIYNIYCYIYRFYRGKNDYTWK
ncbi:glycosyl transferase family 2 [Bacteroidales bacterium]|nr:glycosyl transferase family 2 [Bacteroidales bacterium]